MREIVNITQLQILNASHTFLFVSYKRQRNFNRVSLEAMFSDTSDTISQDLVIRLT